MMKINRRSMSAVAALFLGWPCMMAAQDSASVVPTRVNVRQSASASAPIVTALTRGTSVRVIERRAGWAHVTTATVRGWIRGDLIRVLTKNPSESPKQPAAADEDKAATSVTAAAEQQPPIAIPSTQPATISDTWNFRDPGSARQYAWYAPGGGHLYSGETLKGAVLLAAPLVALYTGIPKIVGADCGRGFALILFVKCAPLHTAVMVGAYAFGILDADDSARRMNERRGLVGALSRARMQPTLAHQQGQSLRYGFLISLQ